MIKTTEEELVKIIREAGLYDPNLEPDGKPSQNIASDAIAKLLVLNYQAMKKQDRLNFIGTVLAVILGIGEIILAYLTLRQLRASVPVYLDNLLQIRYQRSSNDKID